MDLPLQITDVALKKLAYARTSDTDIDKNHKIRISVRGGGCSGFIPELTFDNEYDINEDYTFNINVGDDIIPIVIDEFSYIYLSGMALDYINKGFEEGFKFYGGSSTRTCGCGASMAFN